MARLCATLLFMALPYALASHSKHTFHNVYKPYGPRMCAGLCEQSDPDYEFHFMEEDLSCRRRTITCWDNHTSGDFLNSSQTNNRMTKNIPVAETTSDDTSKKDSKDDSVEGIFKQHAELPASCQRDQVLLQSTQNMSLQKACEEGRLCVVKYILSLGLDINSRLKNGKTPVMVAVRNGHLAVFDFLVSQNCSLTCLDAYNNSILHSASCGGNTIILEKLLNSAIYHVDVKGWLGRTPVMLALLLCQKQVFNLLASCGSNLTAVDAINMNILHFACLCGDVDVVEYILSLNILSLESRDMYGRTPVMAASTNGQVEAVEILVKKGCKIKVLDYYGNNILHVACSTGQVKMVKYILQKGFLDINSVNRNGFTPVMQAAVKCHGSVVNLLLRNNCSLSQLDVNGNNVLHLASLKGHINIVKVILAQKKVNIDSRGVKGKTAVLLAARYGHMGVIQVLKKEGCDLKRTDNMSSNILHMACMSGNVTVVKYILSLNVSLESTDLNKMTPVMTATKHGHVNIVKFLHSKGCNLTKLNVDKDNILHIATYNGTVDVVKYTLTVSGLGINSRGLMGLTPVMYAAQRGHKDIFDLLVSKGCNPTLLDDYNDNILHLASVAGKTEMVNHIISMDIVEINSRGWRGKTPVLLAAGRGFIEVVDLLYNKGCDTTLLDSDGNNILHVACFKGHIDMVNYILGTVEVDTDSRGLNGRTPVMMAVDGNHIDVVKRLVSKGCKVTAVDDLGYNILHLACHFRHVDMVQYILRHRLVDEKQSTTDGWTALTLAENSGNSDIITLLKAL